AAGRSRRFARRAHAAGRGAVRGRITLRARPPASAPTARSPISRTALGDARPFASGLHRRAALRERSSPTDARPRARVSDPDVVGVGAERQLALLGEPAREIDDLALLGLHL